MNQTAAPNTVTPEYFTRRANKNGWEFLEPTSTGGEWIHPRSGAWAQVTLDRAGQVCEIEVSIDDGDGTEGLATFTGAFILPALEMVDGGLG